MKIPIHKVRAMITSLPIKNTNWRWRICERNRNIGWNECRLEFLKQISYLRKNEDLSKKGY